MIKKIILVYLLLIVSSVVSADAVVVDNTITRVDMGWLGEGVFVSTAENTNNYGCQQSRFGMPVGTPLFDQNLALLLSAFHTGSKVELYIDGCFGGVINLKAVTLVK